MKNIGIDANLQGMCAFEMDPVLNDFWSGVMSKSLKICPDSHNDRISVIRYTLCQPLAAFVSRLGTEEKQAEMLGVILHTIASIAELYNREEEK